MLALCARWYADIHPQCRPGQLLEQAWWSASASSIVRPSSHLHCSKPSMMRSSGQQRTSRHRHASRACLQACTLHGTLRLHTGP